MSQINDSFGWMISLVLSGNTLTVKRQDTGAVLFIYSVSESNGTLISATDAAGRVTGYTYSQQTLETQMSRKETGDEAVAITFMNLAAVNHPTGARTEYTYSPVMMFTPHRMRASMAFLS